MDDQDSCKLFENLKVQFPSHKCSFVEEVEKMSSEILNLKYTVGQ